MQLNVLNDLAEAMKALDGKKMEKTWFSQIHLFHSSAALSDNAPVWGGAV